MKFLCIIFLFLVGLFSKAQPISLHPANAHYFLYKGEITPLITSGEHYGSVINLDFDYETYLNTLQLDGLNYTRIFVGSYIEKPGAFGISENTLAPKANRLMCPWARSNIDGYNLGGNKFDLDQWDKEYFLSLKDFLKKANDRGIVAEVTFFSSFYEVAGWQGSPLNSINNINYSDTLLYRNVQTIQGNKINEYQIKMVKKVVEELNGFDNIFYEIQNEPWSDNGQKVNNTSQPDKSSNEEWQKIIEIPNEASLKWQKNIADEIVKSETNLPKKHLIAQNFANFHQDLSKIPNLEHISIFNFHYAHTKAAFQNAKLNKVIGFDESGFSGSTDSVYRRQAWRWLLAGGGLFNNLDYSFTANKPDGTAIQKAPGGGSVAFRKQMKFLKTQIMRLNLKNAKPDTTTFKIVEGTARLHCLTDGKKYLIYIEGDKNAKISFGIKKAKYEYSWFDPKNGNILKKETKITPSKSVLQSVNYEEDVVLLLNRIK